MVHHDVEDVRDLLDAVKGLSREDYERVRLPGSMPIAWDGPDESLSQVMEHLVLTREVWLAAIEGGDYPDLEESDPVELVGATRRPHRAGWRWCGTSTVAARGATGWSTRSASHPRASSSAPWWPTSSPTPRTAGTWPG